MLAASQRSSDLVPGHGGTPLVLVVIALVVGAPWVAAIIWAVRHGPRDGAMPLSMGDRARQRLRSW